MLFIAGSTMNIYKQSIYYYNNYEVNVVLVEYSTSHFKDKTLCGESSWHSLFTIGRKF